MIDQYTDYDSPWKEMLEQYFEQFMAFFFPAAYEGIDWAKGYRFLDKELQQVVRDAELGRRLVDKLVEVVHEGYQEETWVLIHVEMQGFWEKHFDKRMYIYNYRLFDRYDRSICSLAVLRGYAREDILELTRFMDWIMVLPKELEQRFDDAMAQYEEEQKMQYVTSFERRGIEKGVQQGLHKDSNRDFNKSC